MFVIRSEKFLYLPNLANSRNYWHAISLSLSFIIYLCNFAFSGRFRKYYINISAFKSEWLFTKSVIETKCPSWVHVKPKIFNLCSWENISYSIRFSTFGDSHQVCIVNFYYLLQRMFFLASPLLVIWKKYENLRVVFHEILSFFFLRFSNKQPIWI